MITWIYLDYLAILNEFHCQLNTTCTLVETLCILQFAAIKNTELQQKINNVRNNNKNHGKQENICILQKLPTLSLPCLFVSGPIQQHPPFSS